MDSAFSMFLTFVFTAMGPGNVELHNEATDKCWSQTKTIPSVEDRLKQSQTVESALLFVSLKPFVSK